MLDTKACKGARTSFTKSQGRNPRRRHYKVIIRLLRQRIARLIQPHCDTCGICVGPDYIEHYTTKVGERELCGSCLYYLGKYGFLQLDDRHRLLPNGEIEDKCSPEAREKDLRDKKIINFHKKGSSTEELVKMFKVGKRTIQRVISNDYHASR